MRTTQFVLIDLRDVMRIVEDDGPFEPTIYETWLARLYCKAHSVPCVSISLLATYTPDHVSEFIRLTQTAQLHRVDPILMLPHPKEIHVTEGGICFFVRNDKLLMGTGRAIEKCWRSLYP